MDDTSSTPAVQPVPSQPPEQEPQTQNPSQYGQTRTPDNPPSAGVSAERAASGKAAVGQQDFAPTAATTIEEMVKAAYFVADGIDAPVVEVVNPHVINLHYPADGSLATVKVEARSGAWGGLAHKGTPEQDADRNAHYYAMKAAAEVPPPVEPPPEEPAGQQQNPNPAWTVQRQ